MKPKSKNVPRVSGKRIRIFPRKEKKNNLNMKFVFFLASLLLILAEWFLSLEPEFGTEEEGEMKLREEKKRERRERQDADAHVILHVSAS